MVDLPNKTTWRLRDQIQSTLTSHSGIQDVSIVSGAPGEFSIRLGKKPSDISPQEKAINKEESITFAPSVVDYHFLDLLHIKLLAGRNFSKDLSSDKEQAYILNKKGVEKLGWSPEEAIGKTFKLADKEGKIIGVVENFHITSLRNAVEPVVLQLHKDE